MEEIIFGTKLIEALQSLSPAFDQIFLFFTWLGEDFVFTALIGIAYWCLNKKGAVFAFYVLTLSGYLHYFLKMELKMERPPPEYRIVGKQDISYGFPSGHAQNVATFWSWAWLKIRRAWIVSLSITMMFIVGLSRVYLGVHYPGDVIGAVIVGVLFSVLSLKLSQIVAMQLKNPYRLLNHIAPILAVSLLSLSLLIFPDRAMGDPSASLGSLFGFPIGVMLEMKYVNFSTDVSFGIKISRIVIGFGIVMGLMMILPLLLPSEIIYLRFARYAVISFAGAFIVPLIFKMLKK